MTIKLVLLLITPFFTTPTYCMLSQGAALLTRTLQTRAAKGLGAVYREAHRNKHTKPGLLSSELQTHFLNALTKGHDLRVQNALSCIIQSSIGFDDVIGTPEKSYHLFLLGLLMPLKDSYDITSSRESGFGKYDIMLAPKDKNKSGIIIELKKINESDASPEIALGKALDQIQRQAYTQVLFDADIQTVLAYGIACRGKRVFVKQILLEKE